MARTREQKGRRARQYGHSFERLIVRKVKERFAHSRWAEHVRRSDQSHRASLPDVTGWPKLWPELETAEDPDPAGKLAQAQRDVGALPYRAKPIPVAITHKKRARRIFVTLALDDVARMIGPRPVSVDVASFPVTMQLEDFFVLYEHWGAGS
jgi:hypothetical protein